MSDVMDDTVAEAMQLARAAAMTGRLLADARRERLWRAEARARAQARAMREEIAREVELARPILAQVRQERFWEHASAEDVARVYGVAVRYATVDHEAALAVQVCERQARERLGGDLTGGAMRAEGDASSVGDALRTSPAVAGVDESVDWSQTARAAVAAHEAEVAARAGGDVSAELDRQGELMRTEVARVLDEHPEVVQVRVDTAEAVDSDGRAVAVPAFHALTGDGMEASGVSVALDDASDLLSDPSGVLETVGGRTWDREGLVDALGRPQAVPEGGQQGQQAPVEAPAAAAVRAGQGQPVSMETPDFGAGALAPSPPVPAPGQDPARAQGAVRRRLRPSEAARRRWDSRAARERWGRERRSEGLDSRQVRAALSGDQAMSRPAVEATSTQRARRRLRPQSRQAAGQVRRSAMAR